MDCMHGVTIIGFVCEFSTYIEGSLAGTFSGPIYTSDRLPHAQACNFLFTASHAHQYECFDLVSSDSVNPHL